MSFGWKPYVSAADRRKKAEREMAKLRTKGHISAPVVIKGRKLATTFWGQAWGDNLESYSDYENRLPRGRTYVRNGSVVDLQVNGGEINAKVMGSALYKVVVKVAPLPKARWNSICTDCAGSIDSLVELLQGRLSKAVMERVCRQETGLFPAPSEITLSCSCPDWASMCKHLAAVLYGIGARLDEQPELVFKLRAVDHAELIASAAKGGTLTSPAAASARVLDGDDLSALFGLDMGDQPEPESQDRRTARRQTGDEDLAVQTVQGSHPKGLGSNRRRKAIASDHKDVASDRGSHNPNDDAIASNAQPAVQDVHGRLNTYALNTTKRDSSAANRIADFPTPVQNSSMATLLQLQKQMSQLQSELERVRRAEAQTVIARMQKDIATYGITAADLGFAPASSSTSSSTPAAPSAKKTRGPGLKQAATASAKKTPGIAKFRDPKSGKTWTGQGKPPGWIAGKKDRTPFLIAAPDASPMIATEQVSASVKKASKKSAAKKSAGSVAPNLAETSAAPAPVAVKKAVAKKAAVKKAAPTKKGAPAKKVAIVAKKAAQARPQAAKKAPATKLASKSAAKPAKASAKAKAPKAVLSKAALALSQPTVGAAQGTLPLDASAA
jgi:uncharacterized Zn finger protein